MDLRELPHWATPLPGESRASWLAATGQRLPIDERDWQAHLQADQDEPERVAPTSEQLWCGLPRVLGDIDRVPTQWRLAPSERHVYCRACYVDQDGSRRWPIRIPWLDARCLICERHDRVLEFVRPCLTDPIAPDMRQSIPEIALLCKWLSQWQAAGSLSSQEDAWRTDLVTLALRNWNHIHDVGAYAPASWELYAAGWVLPRLDKNFAPGGPTQLGYLGTSERIGALVTAFRCWRRLAGQEETEPPYIQERGWAWLERRWASATKLRGRVHAARLVSRRQSEDRHRGRKYD